MSGEQAPLVCKAHGNQVCLTCDFNVPGALVPPSTRGFEFLDPELIPNAGVMTVPMILYCPNGHRHIDEERFEHVAHHTHACQECGIVWRPAKVNTHGVRFLPGYKNTGLVR